MTIDELIVAFRRAVTRGYTRGSWSDRKGEPVVGILTERGLWNPTVLARLQSAARSDYLPRPSDVIGELLGIDRDAAWIIYMVWNRNLDQEEVVRALEELKRGRRPP